MEKGVKVEIRGSYNAQWYEDAREAEEERGEAHRDMPFSCVGGRELRWLGTGQLRAIVSAEATT